jgi:uncharacterized protein
VKPSRYNHWYRVDDREILGYNALTTALVRLTDDEFDCFQDFCDRPADDFFAERGAEPLRKQLVDTGLIIADDVDELARIAGYHRLARQQRNQLSLTVIPTLACNFRCNYCFSYAKPGRMNGTVQDDLVRFTERRLDGVQSFTISWYGGEPLLCLPIIERLAGRLHGACEQRGVTRPGDSIVTNGYLLTRRAADRLKGAGVARAQVTLDGGSRAHNARRPLANGRPTFDRILENLSAVADVLDIQVRINVDRSNADTAVGALDALAAAGLQHRVVPYFGHVQAFSDLCSDIAGTCLSGREFSELDFELTKQALVRGFDGFPYPRSSLHGRCIADNPLGFVVAPDGLLFKCWAEASQGSYWSVGHVADDVRSERQEINHKLFEGADALKNEGCRACRVLPLCMGGCPHVALRNPGSMSCTQWNYTLGRTLALRSKFRDRFRSRSSALGGQHRAMSGADARTA